MLRDLYFYPLAGLVIAAMIAFALSLGDYERPSDQQIRAQGYVLQGEDLTRLTASAATNSEFIAQTASTPAHARLWTHIAKENVGLSAGVFATMDENHKRVFAGERLRLTITARQSRYEPLEVFEAGYFASGANATGWLEYELTPEWQDYQFEFTPKFPEAKADIDYFGIWPGDTADLRYMDVSKMQVEVLE